MLKCPKCGEHGEFIEEYPCDENGTLTPISYATHYGKIYKCKKHGKYGKKTKIKESVGGE